MRWNKREEIKIRQYVKLVLDNKISIYKAVKRLINFHLSYRSWESIRSKLNRIRIEEYSLRFKKATAGMTSEQIVAYTIGSPYIPQVVTPVLIRNK